MESVNLRDVLFFVMLIGLSGCGKIIVVMIVVRRFDMNVYKVRLKFILFVYDILYDLYMLFYYICMCILFIYLDLLVYFW